MEKKQKMPYSEVLTKILRRAGEVQRVAKGQHLSAPAILAAGAELCAAKYHGLTDYRSEHVPVWYEEERLRYLYGKLFRVGGTLVGTSVMRRLQEEYLTYDVDFMETHQGQLETLMKARNTGALTADVVFLVALDSIKDRQRMGLEPQYQSEIRVAELLAETDSCIYDYVTSEIGKMQEQLQKKADEARKKRDWKPAAKFAEPEELLERFFAAVQVTKGEKSLELTFPYFYHGEKELKLTIIRVDGVYYVTDTQGVTGCFCQLFDFMKYLQRLILLAKSDVTGYIPKADVIHVDRSEAEVFDWEVLLCEMKQSVCARYDENEGLILSVAACCYAGQNVSVSFLLETLEDGKVRIRDNEKGFEKVEHLEGFSLTEELTDGFYIPLLFKFFNFAVLIAELETPMERLPL